MKYCVLIVIFFIYLEQGCSAQVGDFDWDKIEYTISFEEKQEIVSHINHWLIDYLKSLPFNALEDKKTISNFHCYDFSGDGMMDLIYYGPAGAESFITIFFENQGNTFKDCLSFYGKPITIFKPVNNYPAIIKMYEYGCCEDSVCSLQLFIPKKTDSILKYQLTRKLNFIEGTYLPCQETISKKFIVTNEEYNLRTEPFIPSDSTNNIIATFSKGTKGIAFAERVDPTGRKWWYVNISSKSNNLIKTTINAGLNNNAPFEFVGWISSRYLKEIKH